MKKNRESAKRIKRLMRARGQTQAQFARSLEVSQATVSSWLSANDAPSPLSCLVLATLAPEPDSGWFSKRAGHLQGAMRAAAERFSKESRRPPVEGETARLSPFVRPANKGLEVLPELVVPLKAVPNDISTRYIVLDKHYHGGIFREGETVLLDTSDRGAKNLEPFWDHFVLVEFKPSSARIAADLPHSWEGLYIGRLVLKPVLTTVAPMLAWVGELNVFDDPRGAGNPLVGSWSEDLSPGEESETVYGGFPPYDEASRQRALRHLMNRDDREILGRIIGWFER